MKITGIISMAGLISTMLLTACSNDNNIAANDDKIEVSGEQFTITTEQFGTDETVSRAAVIQPTTVDLGDGVMAEVSVRQDASEERETTRATAIGDGHYTIYALDAAGLRAATMTGTVSGNKFVRDATSPRMILTPGTYTFVCYNDAVTDSGTGLTVVPGTDNPMIAMVTETISGPGWQINFEMKHQSSRVRFRLTAYTSVPTGVTATVADAGTAQPISASYNPNGTAAATATGTLPTGTYNYTPSVISVPWSPYTLPYTATSDYYYYLPATDGSKFTLTFTSGNIYGESIASKTVSLSSILSTLDRNHSYTVDIKFTTQLFLFNDGTVGVVAERGTRTAIGWVIKDKTTTEEGMAMAGETPGAGVSGVDGQFYNSKQYDQSSAGFFPAVWSDMDGYNYTWNPAYSHDGATVNAEDVTQTGYNRRAYYVAGHYSPSVSTSNIGKWYLPTIGELALMMKKLRIADFTNQTSGGMIAPDHTYADRYAAKSSLTYPTGFMLSSTETSGYGDSGVMGFFFDSSNVMLTYWPKHQPAPVYPFVHW